MRLWLLIARDLLRADETVCAEQGNYDLQPLEIPRCAFQARGQKNVGMGRCDHSLTLFLRGRP